MPALGVIVSDGPHDPATRLLRDADVAVFVAKEMGRGRVELFDGTMRDRAVRRLEIESALRRALVRGEFRVHYQPVVEIASSEMIGLEALVRWQHPDLGLLEPADFLDVAEDTGLIVPIGAWVLHEAYSQTARWCAELPQESPLSIAVNLSARQLNDPELVSIVESTLAGTRLNPSLLTLEINETVLVENRERAADVLPQLAARGVRIGIDDFGTGQSSLAHLNEFPVHTLKIDRSLIEGLGNHQTESAIVSAIVGLGHALGFTVTAEGIENDMQLHTMRTLGCDLAQGYYFARPQPGEVMRALVRHRFRWSQRVSA